MIITAIIGIVLSILLMLSGVGIDKMVKDREKRIDEAFDLLDESLEAWAKASIDLAEKSRRVVVLERQLAKAKRKAEKERNKRIRRSLDRLMDVEEKQSVQTAAFMENMMNQASFALWWTREGYLPPEYKKYAREYVQKLSRMPPIPLP